MIVAVATQKGGSAKTTTVVNLAAALAERGGRTLVIDLDGQAHSTLWLLGPAARQQGPFVQDWLENKAKAEASVHRTPWANLDVVPTSLAINHLRDRLQAANRAADSGLLRKHLSSLAQSYAWVLLDCPAGLNSLTINALVAADRLLIPVAPPDPLAVDGIRHILTTAERVTQGANRQLRVLGALIGNTQLRRATERRQVALMHEAGLPILATTIPSSARVGQAAEAHCPVIVQAPSSPIAAAFRELAGEVEAAGRSGG
jgi:chromosome partitioning protein